MRQKLRREICPLSEASSGHVEWIKLATDHSAGRHQPSSLRSLPSMYIPMRETRDRLELGGLSPLSSTRQGYVTLIPTH